MKSNKILQVVSDKKNGQRMALDRDGNLWCQKVFRYGGDEFLVVYQDMAVKTAEERMKTLNENLHNLKEEGFSLSISFGVTESTVHASWKELIQTADRKMYSQKQDKRIGRAAE